MSVSALPAHSDHCSSQVQPCPRSERNNIFMQLTHLGNRAIAPPDKDVVQSVPTPSVLLIKSS